MTLKNKEEIQPIDAEFDDVSNALVAPSSKTHKAIFEGKLPIGDIELDCAVLEDGTRVFSERAIHRAFGISTARRSKELFGGAVKLPSFLGANNINSFISNELLELSKLRIEYTKKTGGSPIRGYKAEILPEICEVWLKARQDKALLASQMRLAEQAEILMRAFARVGIVALIDEATGYQFHRPSDALRFLVNYYIVIGLRKWIKQFRDEFFAELDKLYDNEKTTSRNRPQYYGKFINKYIYEPLENGFIKAELNKLNITDEGKRKARFHQWFSDNGLSILQYQIGRVMTIMEISGNIKDFKENIKILKPTSLSPELLKLIENSAQNEL